MEGNKIPEEPPCDVPSIENIEDADKSTKDSDKTTAAERRKNKRKNRRKTNSDSCETNPFSEEKLETKVSEPEPEDAVEASPDKNVSQKPKVVVPSPPGIPRPLPINKPRSNRDSFIFDDDDFIKEAFIVSKSKSVTDTEEFKKAGESFDQMFSEEGGNETPEIKRLSMQSSPEVKRMSIPMMQTSPNVNWKRIKTSRSFEKDESSEHQEIHESQEAYSVRTETFQMESNQTSFKTSEKKESWEQHQQNQSHSVSQEHHEVSHKVSENYQ